MNLSSLMVPLLLALVAAYGLGRRVDVYAALTRGRQTDSPSCCGSSPPWWDC